MLIRAPINRISAFDKLLSLQEHVWTCFEHATREATDIWQPPTFFKNLGVYSSTHVVDKSKHKVKNVESSPQCTHKYSSGY